MTNEKDSMLDSILVKIGELGRYQCFVFTLFCLAIILDSTIHTAFVFTAADLDYRCEIQVCDLNSNYQYEPDWLKNAVPYEHNKPEKCDKFKVITPTNLTDCKADDFDNNITEKCNELVFETSEETIVRDFDIYCEENLWKLTLVGTVNNVGLFVGLPITGILADRYGRRNVLVIGLILCGFAGIAKSFISSYIGFLILEFMDGFLGSGSYPCGFVLGIELVGPSKRIVSGIIVSSMYAIGEITIASLAWWLQSWRPLLLTIYIPTLFLFSYFWFTPESVRWLISQNRIKEAQDILRKAAIINKRTVPEVALAKLAEIKGDDQTETLPFKKVFQSKRLIIRFIICSYCWIACTFVFYGLTLNSVALDGNKYFDFILTALVEIPAYILTWMIVDRWGRRLSLFLAYSIAGICCFCSIFTSEGLYGLQLTTYLAGKFGATMAFTVIYIVTSEIFPTSLRQSLMGSCSMIGRLGSMLAPQVPLLTNIWKPLPLLLFSIIATVAGLMALLFPETVHMKLPDTIEEAENIGRNIKRKK